MNKPSQMNLEKNEIGQIVREQSSLPRESTQTNQHKRDKDNPITTRVPLPYPGKTDVKVQTSLDDSIQGSCHKPKSMARGNVGESKTSDESSVLANDPNPFTDRPKHALLLDSQLAFPMRLMNLLDNDAFSDIAQWMPNGKSFRIHNTKRFEEEAMPAFFGQKSKFSSFARKLNRWKFSRVAKGEDAGSYFHPKFIRGNKELCNGIRSGFGTDDSEPMDPVVALSMATPAMLQHGLVDHGCHKVSDLVNAVEYFGINSNLLQPTPIHPQVERSLSDGRHRQSLGYLRIGSGPHQQTVNMGFSSTRQGIEFVSSPPALQLKRGSQEYNFSSIAIFGGRHRPSLGSSLLVSDPDQHAVNMTCDSIRQDNRVASPLLAPSHQIYSGSGEHSSSVAAISCDSKSRSLTPSLASTRKSPKMDSRYVDCRSSSIEASGFGRNERNTEMACPIPAISNSNLPFHELHPKPPWVPLSQSVYIADQEKVHANSFETDEQEMRARYSIAPKGAWATAQLNRRIIDNNTKAIDTGKNVMDMGKRMEIGAYGIQSPSLDSLVSMQRASSANNIISTTTSSTSCSDMIDPLHHSNSQALHTSHNALLEDYFLQSDRSIRGDGKEDDFLTRR